MIDYLIRNSIAHFNSVRCVKGAVNAEENSALRVPDFRLRQIAE